MITYKVCSYNANLLSVAVIRIDAHNNATDAQLLDAMVAENLIASVRDVVMEGEMVLETGTRTPLYKVILMG